VRPLHPNLCHGAAYPSLRAASRDRVFCDEGTRKTYPGVVALAGVDFDLVDGVGGHAGGAW
jgi:hypothetical protein